MIFNFEEIAFYENPYGIIKIFNDKSNWFVTMTHKRVTKSLPCVCCEHAFLVFDSCFQKLKTYELYS